MNSNDLRQEIIHVALDYAYQNFDEDPFDIDHISIVRRRLGNAIDQIHSLALITIQERLEDEARGPN